jgi:hypothetical protein
MTASEEQSIRPWLAAIEETDSVVIGEVLEKCRQDADARRYYLQRAIRAQSQCRSTLETLSALKNPPIVYARQANVTTGPQQVNNGVAPPSRIREIENQPIQLSGEHHELLPDTRTSGIASRIDPALETVGKINRAKDAGR